MNETIESIVSSLLTSSPAVVLAVVLIGVGRVLKGIERFPNWAIPVALLLLGGLAYPYIGEQSSVIKAARFPTALMALYGFGIGLTAVGIYETGRTILERFTPTTVKSDQVIPNQNTPTPPTGG